MRQMTSLVMIVDTIFYIYVKKKVFFLITHPSLFIYTHRTITNVALNAEANRLAVGDASGVVVYEIPSGKTLLTVPNTMVEPHWGLCWIKGSDHLAVVTAGDKRVQVWKI